MNINKQRWKCGSSLFSVGRRIRWLEWKWLYCPEQHRQWDSLWLQPFNQFCYPAGKKMIICLIFLMQPFFGENCIIVLILYYTLLYNLFVFFLLFLAGPLQRASSQSPPEHHPYLYHIYWLWNLCHLPVYHHPHLLGLWVSIENHKINNTHPTCNNF